MGGIRGKSKSKKPKPKRGASDPAQRGAGYADTVLENTLFESFYRRQGFCRDEKEFAEMMEAFRRDLPASFRVTGFRSQATAVRNLIESKYFKDLSEVKLDGPEQTGEEPVAKVSPKCLPWYPDRMGWQLNLTRRDIRRVEAYFKLHNFLISETESGNISRQETVSMIPPVVLDVKPHHKVLDMCAAPGSKTAQLIEAIHADETVIPSGLVVANDADNSRCYMLVHQAKRLQSPNVIITNHDATVMPKLYLGGGSWLKFDRILCDVPCTGDGTLRKNKDIWPKWNAANSCNLHGIQFRVLKRGIELLEVGGRLVYSTCSLNPVEDEAVIHRLLKDADGSIELVDPSPMVPGLLYQPGLSSWVVAAKDNSFYESWEEVPPVHHSLIRPFMFPPSPEMRQKYNLDRCIRVLPHHQDTGGFFVAVLEKRTLCPWESPKNDSQVKDEGDQSTNNGDAPDDQQHRKRKSESGGGGKKKKGRFQGFREDPFVYFPKGKEEPIFEEIRQYFQIQKLDQDMFFTRCSDETKRNNLYFSTLLVRRILEENIGRVKIINTGVKGFTKCENKGTTCTFRLAQEGSLMTIPFMGEVRVIRPTLVDLKKLLLINDTELPTQIVELDEKTQERLRDLPTGSVALVYVGKNEDGADMKLELVGWKGKSSLRAYVPKNERIHYLRLVGGDTNKYEKNKFQLKRDQEKQLREEQQEEANRDNGAEAGASDQTDSKADEDTDNGRDDKEKESEESKNP